MSEPRDCPDCGEWDDGHDNHRCPGSPSERVYVLEANLENALARLDEVEQRHGRLLTLLASRRPSHTFEDRWAAMRDEAEIKKLVEHLGTELGPELDSEPKETT